MNKTKSARIIRWQLLTTVSAAALIGSLCGAAADEIDRPVLWIEAGGQLERLQGSQEIYAPPFVTVLDTNPFTPPSTLQQPPRYALGEEGKISFEPEGSNWVLSVAVRYGRSNGGNKHSHEETNPPSPIALESLPAFHFYRKFPLSARANRFADTLAHDSEKHDVIDFQAGKDVGLGMLGSSTVSAGVRFAQFTSRSNAAIHANPDFAVTYKYATTIFGLHGRFNIPQQHWHLYDALSDVRRSFQGIGPSIAWEASVPMLGNAATAQVSLDWGINGAVLFGRQKVHGHHSTVARYVSNNHFNGAAPVTYSHAYPVNRSRSVTVPNLGGFAGLSLDFPNAKISLGYRADLFLNAVDGGIDTRKSENRGFFGPFANISVGLGD
jgi:hypothetical protein